MWVGSSVAGGGFHSVVACRVGQGGTAGVAVIGELWSSLIVALPLVAEPDPERGMRSASCVEWSCVWCWAVADVGPPRTASTPLTLRPLHEGAATARWRSSKTRQETRTNF